MEAYLESQWRPLHRIRNLYLPCLCCHLVMLTRWEKPQEFVGQLFDRRKNWGLHRFKQTRKICSQTKTLREKGLNEPRCKHSNKASHKPLCIRRPRGRMQEVKRRARLEVAFNFFLALEEIRFHQLAELQLISKHTKTNEPKKPHQKNQLHASHFYWQVLKHQSRPHQKPRIYIYISLKYIYI